MKSNMNTEGIIHLQRLKGESLFLYPFENPREMIRDDEVAPWTGWYGREPEMEALTVCKESLHKNIDKGVMAWLSEELFVPRFLAAAGGFTLVFFFMSFVLRDPFPLVDEIVAGLAAGIALFLFWGKRQYHSVVAQQKKVNARNRVEGIKLHHHPLLEEMEAYLHKIEYHYEEDFTEAFLDPPEGLGEDQALLKRVVENLEIYLGKGDLKRHPLRMRRLSDPSLDDKDKGRIVAWAAARRMDGSLFIFLSGLHTLLKA